MLRYDDFVNTVAAGRKVDQLFDERDELLEILKDLCDLDSESWAIGCGPGFKERYAKAWRRAHEVFEP